MSTDHKPHILVAEDDDDLRLVMSALLRADGHEVTAVADGDGIRSYVYDCVMMDIPKRRVDLLVTDVRMPRMNGLALLAYLQDLGFQMPTVLVTGVANEDLRKKAAALGAKAVLDKPLDADELLRAVRAALHPNEPTSRAA